MFLRSLTEPEDISDVAAVLSALDGKLDPLVALVLDVDRFDLDVQIDRDDHGRLVAVVHVVHGEAVVREASYTLPAVTTMPREIAGGVLRLWITTVLDGIERWKRSTNRKLVARGLEPLGPLG